MTNKKRHPRQQVLYKTIQKSICKIIAQGKHIEDNKFVDGYFNDEPTKKALLFFLTQTYVSRELALPAGKGWRLTAKILNDDINEIRKIVDEIAGGKKVIWSTVKSKLFG